METSLSDHLFNQRTQQSRALFPSTRRTRPGLRNGIHPLIIVTPFLKYLATQSSLRCSVLPLNMSTRGVGNLVVEEYDTSRRHVRDYSAASKEHKTVHDIVDRALVLLESTKGRQGLRALGIRLVTARRDLEHKCLYPKDDPKFARLNDYIDLFLGRVRRDFPGVYLIPLTEGEAAMARTDWKGTRRSTLEEYDPRAAGTLRLNKLVSGWLVPETPSSLISSTRKAMDT